MKKTFMVMPLRFIAGTMFIVAMLVGLFIYSCKREVSQPAEILTVSEAQQWFESQPNKSVTLKSGGDRKFLELKNDWAHAHVSQNDSLGIVAVDVLSKGKFSFVLPEGKRAMDSTGNHKYLNSLSRLVVQKNKRTGNMECFVMTLVGSPAYMEKHNFDLTNNTYMKRQRDFTGSVFYHTVSGKFVNGWRIADGKVVGTCTQLQDDNSGITLKSATKEDCYCVTVTLYNQFCMDWYINGRYSYTDCENRVAEYEDYYLYCSYEPNGGGGYGEGDYEGAWVVEGKDYAPNPSDKFCKINLTPTMPKQMANTCVTSIMEYINHAFCGSKTNEGVYMLDYLQTYGVYVLDKGVALSNIVSFTGRHFNTTNFSNFVTTINSGGIVMTDVKSAIPYSSHNVAVVGYHPDGNLIYMDPETGTLQEAPSSAFKQNYAISITSCKD